MEIKEMETQKRLECACFLVGYMSGQLPLIKDHLSVIENSRPAYLATTDAIDMLARYKDFIMSGLPLMEELTNGQ